MPLRELTMSPLARAHSSTSARSEAAAQLRMTGVLTGDPISSSGLAMKTTRPTGSHGSPGADSAINALSAYRPASSPLFMSVTPGP